MDDGSIKNIFSAKKREKKKEKQLRPNLAFRKTCLGCAEKSVFFSSSLRTANLAQDEWISRAQLLRAFLNVYRYILAGMTISITARLYFSNGLFRCLSMSNLSHIVLVQSSCIHAYTFQSKLEFPRPSRNREVSVLVVFSTGSASRRKLSLW